MPCIWVVKKQQQQQQQKQLRAPKQTDIGLFWDIKE